MTPTFTGQLTRIRRTEGVKAAKAWAKDQGYAVRWDQDGSLYIRDLLA